jgi:hypothetical protein
MVTLPVTLCVFVSVRIANICQGGPTQASLSKPAKGKLSLAAMEQKQKEHRIAPVLPWLVPSPRYLPKSIVFCARDHPVFLFDRSHHTQLHSTSQTAQAEISIPPGATSFVFNADVTVAAVTPGEGQVLSPRTDKMCQTTPRSADCLLASNLHLRGIRRNYGQSNPAAIAT